MELDSLIFYVVLVSDVTQIPHHTSDEVCFVRTSPKATMGYVGKLCEPLDEEKARKNYEFVRSAGVYFWLQSSSTQLRAHQYVQRLFDECPSAKEAVAGKLAVVTGVSPGGLGFYVAQELALAAQMSVILAGRNAAKLQETQDAIMKEATKRGVPKTIVKLYCVPLDLDDLLSVQKAADDVKTIASQSYANKIHVLVNNAGAVCPTYETTRQGVEANCGRNFLAPHYFTELLMGKLKAAATSTFKPRCTFVASLAYCTTMDMDPKALIEHPEQGGAPSGVLEFQDGECSTKSSQTFFDMYGRSKLGDVASVHYMAKKYKTVNFTSQQPGSVVSRFGSSLGWLGTVYYYGFYAFQFSPSQGAVASLRAALDPDFNTKEALQGAYLHADGNPWPKDRLKIDNPASGQPYGWDDYSKQVFDAANTLIAQLIKKR